MTSVPTLATHTIMANRLISTQQKVYDLQVQLSTGKKSQKYSGISDDAMRLVNYENELSRANNYINTNTVAKTKLSSMNSSVSAAQDSFKEFRDDLLGFSSRDLDPMSNDEISEFRAFQSRAFNIMKSMESYFDIKLDGEYLFSGGRTNYPPVELPYASVDEFQAVYDGNTVTAPESRYAHMNNTVLTSSDTGDLTMSNAGNTITAATTDAFNLHYFDNGDTGNIDMDNTNNQIRATTAGAFSNLEQGMMIKVAGSGSANNDQFYTINSISTDGRTLTVVPDITDNLAGLGAVELNVPSVQPGPMTLSGSNNNNRTFTVTDVSSDGTTLTVNPSPVDETLTAPSSLQISNDIYYQGGQTVVQHRVDETRTIEFGINAKDGAIEKAFRALGMVVQGIPLDATSQPDGVELTRRLDEALSIANDAILHNAADASESSADFSRLENLLASNQVVLENAVTEQETYTSFLAMRISDMENADATEVAAMINDEKTALEISYATFALVKDLSLLNYIG